MAEDAAAFVRRYFAMWSSGDRDAMEGALADDFRFSSPRDDRLDKRAFFERCWPHHAEIARFDLEDVVADGSTVFVRYVAVRARDGGRFAYLPAKDVARAPKFYEGTLGREPTEELAGGVAYSFGGGTAAFLYATPMASCSRATTCPA